MGAQDGKCRSGPLAAGATGSHDLYAYLRPGVNTLRLSIDSAKQVPEGDEDNNLLAVTVNVEGTCQARGASADPATTRTPPRARLLRGSDEVLVLRPRAAFGIRGRHGTR